MENFTLKRPYFYLVLLFLCFNLFKKSMSAIHLHSLKMLIIEIHEVQYNGTMEMFNNRRFSSSSLNYSYFSKKYHNDDTFTFAIRLIILALWHLIYNLINWKFRSQFFLDLVGTCNFSRKTLYLSMIGVYVHHIWLSLAIIRLSGDIEENPGPRCNSNQSFSICHWNLNYLKIFLLRAYISLHNFDVVCISEIYLDFTTALDNENLAITRYNLLRPIMQLIVRGTVFVYIIKVHLL